MVFETFPNHDNDVKRDMATVLQDEDDFVKLTITRSFRNRIRSGLLYLRAISSYVYVNSYYMHN